MRVIQTTKAPAAVGPYSQAIQAGNTVFLSGQLGLNPQTGALVQGFEAQVRQAMDNIHTLLAEAGLNFSHVVNSDVFLLDLDEFARFNAIYAQYFGTHKPCRTTIQAAGLPLGGLVEIRCTAVAPE